MEEHLKSVCEEETYQKLYYQHAEAIRNYLYYKYGNLKQAEDIVQDSFASLWVHCQEVVVEAAKSFLYKVANNSTLNAIKHQKIVLNYKSTEQSRSYTNESPDFFMEEQEFKQRLTTAIAGLKENQREVFLLNRLEKKTYSEIAEMLDISVKAVEKRMHLALKILRVQIGNI